MSGRPFFLRGYGDRPFTHSIPSPADDCVMCRGGKWPCPTPAACGIAEPEHTVVNLPLFADTPLASKAIGWALVLGLLATIAAATGLMQ